MIKLGKDCHVSSQSVSAAFITDVTSIQIMLDSTGDVLVTFDTQEEAISALKEFATALGNMISLGKDSYVKGSAIAAAFVSDEKKVQVTLVNNEDVLVPFEDAEAALLALKTFVGDV